MRSGIALTSIQSGKPQQDAYVERYNWKIRHEWLDLYKFENTEELQQVATGWRWTRYKERSNIFLAVCTQTNIGQPGIGGVTPVM